MARIAHSAPTVNQCDKIQSMEWKPKTCECGQPRHTNNKCKECAYEYKRGRNLLRSYKLSEDAYRALLESQGGVCALCGIRPTRGDVFMVDHNHACCPGPKTCGSCVRGLLCPACNSGLGLFRDNPEALRKAVTYVDRGRKAISPGAGT